MALAAEPWPTPTRPDEASLVLRPLAAKVFGLGDAEAREAGARLLQQAVEWRTQAGLSETATTADLLGDIATVRYYQGRWEESERLDREVLALRLRVLGEDHPSVAEGRRALGISAYKQGRLAEAGELFEAAVAGRGQEGDPLELAHDLNALGEQRRATGRLDEARTLFLQALQLAGEEPVRRSWILGNLGLLDKDVGRLDAAVEHLNEALALARTLGDPYRVALALQNRAEALREARRFDEAAVALAEALALAREALGPDAAELASFESQQATLAAANGDLDAAAAGWDAAESILARTVPRDHPLRAQTLHDAGLTLCAFGRGEVGEAKLREALGARAERFGEGHPDTAVSRARLAGCVARDPARGDEALGLVRRALEDFARTVAYPEEEAEALALEAELLVGRGLPLAAIDRLRQAVAIIEAQRTSSAGGDAARAERFARWAERYRRLVALELDAGDIGGAFEVAERMRARVFLEQLAAGRVDLRAGIAPEVLAPLEAEERRVAALVAELQQRAAFVAGRDDLEAAVRRGELEVLDRDLAAATRELARVGEAIRRESPLWRDVVTAGGAMIDLERARSEVVPRDGLLLVYQLGARDGRVMVVPPAGRGEAWAAPLEVTVAQAEALGVAAGPFGAESLAMVLEPTGTIGAPEVLEGVRGLVKIAPPGARAVASAPGRLAALLDALVPREIRSEVERAEEVVVVADGALHRLPFEALVVREGRRPTYWLDAWPRVRYAASATVLATLGAHAGGAGDRATVVADPVFGAPPAALRAAQGFSSLPALPGTAAEADAIDAALSPALGSGVAVLRGSSATEAAVRTLLARPQRIVHFATHGLVDEERAELLAGLALTPGSGSGNEDDGFLQLFEIYGLDLAAELAVLSACDSAVGKEIGGEGVFALSRGFLAAGARSVVASQWPVDDAATAELMRVFYDALAEDLHAGRTLEVGAALQRARRAVRHDPRWSSPVYWAPFVLAGAGR
jgi:CHAT domain-containing protein/tetratricopeptide (TPR) repeat protein